jgi:SynChlorMet cassette protein ScmD
MASHNRPIANPMIVLREEFDNWAFLFNPETTKIVIINPVGVAVWKAMNGENRSEDIISELKERFADVPETAAEDMDAFIRDLETRGFVGFEIDN